MWIIWYGKYNKLFKNKIRLSESGVWGGKKQFTIWNRRLRVSVIEKIKYGQRLKQVREIILDLKTCFPNREQSKFNGAKILMCVVGVSDCKEPLLWGGEQGSGHPVLKTEKQQEVDHENLETWLLFCVRWKVTASL